MGGSALDITSDRSRVPVPTVTASLLVGSPVMSCAVPLPTTARQHLPNPPCLYVRHSLLSLYSSAARRVLLECRFEAARVSVLCQGTDYPLRYVPYTTIELSLKSIYFVRKVRSSGKIPHFRVPRCALSEVGSSVPLAMTWQLAHRLVNTKQVHLVLLSISKVHNVNDSSSLTTLSAK